VDGVLKGKVALVTGSGTGLGRGIAQALAEAGADIAIAEINQESAATAADELSQLGVRARAYPTDVSKSDQVDGTFAAVAEDLGGLDVVVNNAGISRIGPHTHEVSDEDWHESIAVMQTGVFFGMRAAGRIMVEQGSGSVINISSIRGFSPWPIAWYAPTARAAAISSVPPRRWRTWACTSAAIFMPPRSITWCATNGHGTPKTSSGAGPRPACMWTRPVPRGSRHT